MIGLDYDFNGDDLGTCYYRFRGTTLAKAVNHVIENVDLYKIVHISIHKKYWLFGQNIIEIVMEDPAKIKALEGTQHYSKSYSDSL